MHYETDSPGLARVIEVTDTGMLLSLWGHRFHTDTPADDPHLKRLGPLATRFAPERLAEALLAREVRLVRASLEPPPRHSRQPVIRTWLRRTRDRLPILEALGGRVHPPMLRRCKAGLFHTPARFGLMPAASGFLHHGLLIDRITPRPAGARRVMGRQGAGDAAAPVARPSGVDADEVASPLVERVLMVQGWFRQGRADARALWWSIRPSRPKPPSSASLSTAWRRHAWLRHMLERTLEDSETGPPGHPLAPDLLAEALSLVPAMPAPPLARRRVATLALYARLLDAQPGHRWVSIHAARRAGRVSYLLLCEAVLQAVHWIPDGAGWRRARNGNWPMPPDPWFF